MAAYNVPIVSRGWLSVESADEDDAKDKAQEELAEANRPDGRNFNLRDADLQKYEVDEDEDIEEA
jgi:hypothetical protein